METLSALDLPQRAEVDWEAPSSERGANREGKEKLAANEPGGKGRCGSWLPRTPSFWVLAGLLLLVANQSRTGVHAAVPLPLEFSVVLGSTGVELVWSPAPANATGADGGVEGISNGGGAVPNAAEVRVGGSRPEFRISNGTLLGYPRESQPDPDKPMVLALTLTPDLQDLLEASGGQDLQVWSSGRRLDAGAFSGNATSASSSGMLRPSVAALTPTPTVSVDPAAPGNYSTGRLSYNLFPRVPYSEFAFPMEVVAEVTYPNKTSVQPKSPLVLFLHGRHTSCYKNGPNGKSTLEWPCRTGWKPIPSHQGYRYVADVLASQGYLVVSISANSINAQDDGAADYGASARSILIRHHLSLWADWNANGGDPWSGRFKGTVDLNKVVLVGHSRGGEGVNRAAVDAKPADPFKIVGLVSYGPTAFARQVTPDVHSATILPTCDGDVSDLQGQAYIDASRDIAESPALRSAVIAVGCNHNYFNTEWTPGLAKAPAWDDWYDDSDPVCGATGGSYRLNPQEQQVVGAAYTAALVKLAVKREAAVLPLLDGSFVRPASIGRAEVATHTVGGTGYRLLYRPENSGGPTLSLGMKGGECLGYFTFTGSNPNLPPCDPNGYANSPHWLSHIFDDSYPSPTALNLRWTKTGAMVRFPVAKRKRNFAAFDYVDVRIANDPNRATGAVLELRIQDTQGRSAALNTSLTSIEGWPGSYGLARIHARALRGSLASVRTSSIDLQNITEVHLVSKSTTGKVYVLDVAASQAQIGQPTVLNLPVLSVERITVPEGDGFQTAKLKVRGDRPLTTKGSLWVQQGSLGYKLNLVPGTTNVIAEIPISWVGDDIFSGDTTFSQSVVIGAMSGALTGNFLGGLVIVEDEKPPTLTVQQRTVTANEGKNLEWTFELSAPTSGYSLDCYAVPPGNRTELTSGDVPTSWLRASSWQNPPLQPTPLSSASVYVSVRFDYGITSAKLVVPISSDKVSEADEWVQFQCSDYGTVQVGNLVLFGKVPSN